MRAGEQEPDGGVAAFAQAYARVHDPFADRVALLDAMGLDEGRWGGIEAHWFAEMARRHRAGDPSLGEKFRAAFAEARAALAAERQRAGAAMRLERSGAAVPVIADSTVVGVARLGPALPFKGSHPRPPPSEVDAAAAPRFNAEETAALSQRPVMTTLPFKVKKDD
jgi:hypothetical protein